MPRHNQTNYTKTVSPYNPQSPRVGIIWYVPHPISQDATNTTNGGDAPSWASLVNYGGISIAVLTVVYGCFKLYKKCCEPGGVYRLPEGHIPYGPPSRADASSQSDADHDAPLIGHRDVTYRV